MKSVRLPNMDPITLEVIRNRLESIVREMAEVTLRTARSAVVYTGRDFSGYESWCNTHFFLVKKVLYPAI
mgnify:CR=1 FL=1